jgi:hypothetical protein
MIVIGWREGRGRGQEFGDLICQLDCCILVFVLWYFPRGKMTAGNILDMGENLALGVGKNLEVKTGLLCCVALWSMGSGCFEKSWKFR